MLVTGADEAVVKAARVCSSKFAKVQTRHCEKHVLIKFLTLAAGVKPAPRIAKQNDGGTASTGERKLLSTLAPPRNTNVEKGLVSGSTSSPPGSVRD